jgi:predicted AAA+ superfamily ATPase
MPDSKLMLAEVSAVLTSLASRVRAPLNKTEVSSSVGIPRTSLDRYLTLLEHVFLVRRLPAWHSNRIKQITKAPKLLVSDSALLTHLLRTDPQRLAEDESLLGASLHRRTARGAESTSCWKAPTAGWRVSR